MSALEIDALRIDVAASGHDIVDEVALSIGEGEVLGLVGESGSGKTTVGLAVLGHARKGAEHRGRARRDRRAFHARSRHVASCGAAAASWSATCHRTRARR